VLPCLSWATLRLRSFCWGFASRILSSHYILAIHCTILIYPSHTIFSVTVVLVRWVNSVSAIIVPAIIKHELKDKTIIFGISKSCADWLPGKQTYPYKHCDSAIIGLFKPKKMKNNQKLFYRQFASYLYSKIKVHLYRNWWHHLNKKWRGRPSHS
jgi:hypothetical protein